MVTRIVLANKAEINTAVEHQITKSSNYQIIPVCRSGSAGRKSSNYQIIKLSNRYIIKSPPPRFESHETEGELSSPCTLLLNRLNDQAAVYRITSVNLPSPPKLNIHGTAGYSPVYQRLVVQVYKPVGSVCLGGCSCGMLEQS